MSEAMELVIRIYMRSGSGKFSDGEQDFELSSFGGILPIIGDKISEPGVVQGLDRRDPVNRTVWTVVDRVFNPRDLVNYVALIVEESPAQQGYQAFVR